MVGLDHLHDQLHHRRGGEILPALLHIGGGEFAHEELGIARNILSNRLAKLVEHGILKREPCADDRRKIEYRLTAKGFDLLPAMVALRQWGQKYGSEHVIEDPVLVDEHDRLPIGPVSILAHDGRILGPADLALVRPENLGKRADGSLAASSGVVTLHAAKHSAAG
jgi:DNA-binding HxlR family transcriptional regulator